MTMRSPSIFAPLEETAAVQQMDAEDAALGAAGTGPALADGARTCGGSAGTVGRANPFSAVDPLPIGYLAWVVVWFALILGLAIWSFRTREI